jgi:phenylpropionate dioxygenase-like ring-hydroxylating dioxygenase large terminal subunit
MKAAADTQELAYVGPGTLMGNFMREYWLPMGMSTELKADGNPMRIKLLGEKLIAFRDSSGRVGVLDHHCPHRRASLFLGRNEEDGLRCIYHGWKFDVDGNCLDLPSVVSRHDDFKAKVKAKAYPVRERNGLIWVYMGPREELPPLPWLESNITAEEEFDLVFIQRDCNWLQTMEGDIDSSHLGFLHYGAMKPDNIPEGHPQQYTASGTQPDYRVRNASWGTSYGSFRLVQVDGQEKTYWRFSNYLFPFYTQYAGGQFGPYNELRIAVPLDDEHTMTIWIRQRNRPRGALVPLKDGTLLPGGKPEPDYLPNSTDWLGRWRLVANESNDWMIDRDMQRSGLSFSGIDNINLQDQAVAESMDAITQHHLELLGPGDLMISRTRRRILQAARDFASGAEPAPCVDSEAEFRGARSGFFVADSSQDWIDAYEERVRAAGGTVTTEAKQ